MPPLPPMTTMPLVLSSLRPRPRTKTRTSGALVAFEGACVSAFADGAGPTATTLNPRQGEGGGGGSSAPWGSGTVAAPVDLNVAGQWDRRCHCCCHHRRCLPRLGGGGRGWRGHPPSVVVFADVVGGSGAVPTAEGAPLNVIPSHPDPSQCPSGISPSLSSRPRPPPLPSVATSHPC